MKWCAIILFCIFVVAFVKASPYTKYGRTCRDILCIAGQEECIMKNDECTAYSDRCGSYPTCKRKESAPKRGCASIKCPSGHFCSIRQENCRNPPCEIKPTCIAFRTTSAPRSATTSVVNQRQHGYNYESSYGGQGSRNSWSWTRNSG